MIALLISTLISLGIITCDADFHDFSQDQQEHYQETIVIEDQTGI